MSKLFWCQVAAGSGTDGADDGGLVAACRDGDLVQLQMMLASGVSPDAQDAHWAATSDSQQKVFATCIRRSFGVLLPCLHAFGVHCSRTASHCTVLSSRKEQ